MSSCTTLSCKYVADNKKYSPLACENVCTAKSVHVRRRVVYMIASQNKTKKVLPASYPSLSTWNLLACSYHVMEPKMALHQKMHEPANGKNYEVLQWNITAE